VNDNEDHTRILLAWKESWEKDKRKEAPTKKRKSARVPAGSKKSNKVPEESTSNSEVVTEQQFKNIEQQA
jgi:hypothetical protein